MKEQLVTDALFRQFLLGRVDAEERQRIESLFMSDPLFREKVLAAEQDLVEDYLEDCLNPADRECFLSQFAETPGQRRKLRIARSIKEYAAKTAKVNQRDPATVSGWRTWPWDLRLKPAFFIPIAAILVVAFVGTAILRFRTIKQGNAQHLAAERELASLNDPSKLREAPPQMLSFALTPVSLRSVVPQTDLAPRVDTGVVELRLLWIQPERYPSYRAVLQRVGDTEQFTINDLRSEDDSGKRIRIRLPVRLLTRGAYQLTLSGIAANGATGPNEEYSFAVGG
jgi:hypothetical protein